VEKLAKARGKLGKTGTV